MNLIIQKLLQEVQLSDIHNMNFYRYKSNKGYTTLISVLIVGAIGTAIVISLLTLGISSSQTVDSYQKSARAKALANACLEEGMEKIREATLYTGTGGLSLGGYTCTYTVTSGGGQNRTIVSSATVDNVIRKVNVIIDSIEPSINVVIWQEVP